MSKLHYLCVGRDGIRMIINSSDPCSRDNLITDTLSAGAIVIFFRLSFGVYFCRYLNSRKHFFHGLIIPILIRELGIVLNKWVVSKLNP